MILILNILDNNQAIWRAFDGEKELKHPFAMILGEENILAELDLFLKTNNLELTQTQGLALSIREASLTQVKILVTIINTLGWQLDIPVTASFYSQIDIEQLNQQLITDLDTTKGFTALKAEYQREAEITISKKENKFKIEE